MGTENRRCWGLARSRQVLVPTWRGWLALLGCALLGARLMAPWIHAFLAVTDSRPGGFMVIEGWVSDGSLEAAVQEFRRHPYTQVLVTGGPLEEGAPLAEYKTYAQRGEETLLRMGLSTNQVRAVPAPRMMQDRTYTSALTLRKWFQERGLEARRINLISEGPHARRSRLLFELALGKGAEVGVIALPPTDYDARRWWRTSSGVRGVIGEWLAYLYARLLFQPA